MANPYAGFGSKPIKNAIDSHLTPNKSTTSKTQIDAWKLRLTPILRSKADAQETAVYKSLGTLSKHLNLRSLVFWKALILSMTIRYQKTPPSTSFTKNSPTIAVAAYLIRAISALWTTKKISFFRQYYWGLRRLLRRRAGAFVTPPNG